MKVKNPITKGRVMTPTFFGIMAVVATALIGLRKSAWRPYLELVLFFFGVTIGFGGLGIALFKHTEESGQPWGWGSLISHWPGPETWESIAWHGAPAIVACIVAGHWWWRWQERHREGK